ncbi:GNAT family acetyltransferase [Streptococcus pneumoniae]|nr:GNAT family acetyltransferase [Streptococcus pneumoniae]
MITLVRAGAEDLETIIAIQRASFKARKHRIFTSSDQCRVNESLVGNGSDFASVSRKRVWI